jgi:galactoside O-acetyltransferase
MEKVDSPTLTPQQQMLRDKKGPLATYKHLVAADKSWLWLLGFETYDLIFSGLGGMLGHGVRRTILPHFLSRCGKSPVFGRNISVRQASHIALGNSVILDDNVVLDVRLNENIDSSIEVGDCCFIGRSSILAAKDGIISIGAGCNISSSCRIATESRITLGKNVLVAAYSYIGPGNHQLDSEGRLRIDQAMENKGGVTVGDNVWIGSRVTILDGVTIGDNAIIGAHSLVKDDVPAGATAAGTPAKVIA